MRPEDLFEALTDISDNNLETRAPRRRRWWVPLTAMAAVLALAVGLLPHMGGKGSGSGGFNYTAESSDTVGATAFMSYAGPVLPLTALEPGLRAGRELVWDFSLWEQERAGADILVTDRYTLSGEGSYTLIYPFVSSFMKLEEQKPTLTLNGQTLEGTLYADDLTDGFGRESLPAVSRLGTWEDCKAIVEDGALSRAMEDHSGLEDTPVTVYRLENVQSPEESDKNVNPTLELWFEVDYDKTQVLSYGFSGGSNDPEGGGMGRNTSVGRARYREESHLLIVLGEDIGEIALRGYRTGACQPGNELEGVSAGIRREETTMGAIVEECAADYARNIASDDRSLPDTELFARTALRVMADLPGLERISEGLEFMFDNLRGAQRVFYLAVDVRAEPGAVLEARFSKGASFDFYGETENRNVYGYDLATRLGSSIGFTGQSLSLEHFGGCRIVRQDLGLDPETGVLCVQLDPEQEHYYLEVRAKEAAGS